MILGVVLGNKSYHISKYFIVILIVTGVALFFYHDDRGNNNNNHKQLFHFIGVGEIIVVCKKDPGVMVDVVIVL